MSAPSETSEAGGELNLIESLAAAWLARRDRGLTPEELVEFARWRAADPRHEATVLELDAMWGALDDLAAPQENAAGPQAVVEKFTPRPAQSRSWMHWGWAAAAAVALFAGVAVWQKKPAETMVTAHYETAVGDQRSVALSDGSTLRLNTDSVVDVRYAPGERRVELVRGEAQFTVAKDATRPFIVTGAGIEAKALGTVFIVRRRESSTELVVTEGRVKFGAVSDPSAAKEVAANQAAVCDASQPQSVRVETLDRAALARRVAWETGRFLCRPGMPVSEVVSEFNRYHRQKLVLDDAATGEVKVGGGAFELANLNALLQNFKNNFEIIEVRRDAEHIVLKAKQ